MLNLGDISEDKQRHRELSHCILYTAAAEASHDMNGNAAVDVDVSTSSQKRQNLSTPLPQNKTDLMSSL